jgi:Fe-S oxidoreductase
MAKFKIEARAAWAQRNGIGLRDKLVAYMPRYAPLASRAAALMGVADRMPWVSKQIKRALGLAPQRSLPRFKKSFLSTAVAPASSPAARRMATGVGPAGSGATSARGGATKEVVLFVDTFNNNIEPENARAAQRVLEAAGYTVHFNVQAGERPLCCGRTFLAAGLVDEAKREARRMLDAFKPFVEREVPIVGLEPSCLLSLRDEFLQYGYGEDARKLSQLAFLFEEFLVREQAAGRLDLPLGPLGTRHAWVHGHCHQKAFDAFRPVQTVLGWIPGLEVHTIESSCCGMAGSFGYEAEHYAASQAMAELSLLPALRQIDGDALVVADGTSCRHQIADGVGVEALHVARVLVLALETVSLD